MRKRKLYLLLILLAPEDLSGVKAFLTNSPNHKSKTLSRFFDLWRKRLLNEPMLNEPEGPEMSAEQFVKGSAFTVSRMDKLCSQLYQKVSDYLALNEFQESTYARQEMFLKALERRKAGAAELLRHHDWLRSQVEKMPDSAERRLQILKLKWMLAEATTTTRETQPLWQENFQELHELTDHYYQLQKLKLASASANARNIFNHDTPDPAQPFLASLDDPRMQEKLPPLALAFYYNVAMITKEEGWPYFEKLHYLLKTSAHTFERSEAQELYNYALNFCIRRQNEGQEQYREKMAELYRELLDSGLILEKGRINPGQMKNIVTLNCRLGYLDWVRQFIDEYRVRLTEDAEPYMVTYNEGVLAFFSQDYKTAIQILKEVIPRVKEDVFYELGARVYLWKSYFEYLEFLTIAEVDEMYKMYDAFRIFIDRNQKISDSHKANYKTFIREFKRFMVLLNKKPIAKEQLKELRNELSEIPSMVNKAWFLEKVDSVLAV